VELKDAESFPGIMETVNFTKSSYNDPLSYIIAIQNQGKTNYIIERAMEYGPSKRYFI